MSILSKSAFFDALECRRISERLVCNGADRHATLCEIISKLTVETSLNANLACRLSVIVIGTNRNTGFRQRVFEICGPWASVNAHPCRYMLEIA